MLGVTDFDLEFILKLSFFFGHLVKLLVLMFWNVLKLSTKECHHFYGTTSNKLIVLIIGDDRILFNFLWQLSQWYDRLSGTERTTLSIIALNIAVFGCWRVRSLQPIMLRWFTASPASSKCSLVSYLLKVHFVILTCYFYDIIQ